MSHSMLRHVSYIYMEQDMNLPTSCKTVPDVCVYLVFNAAPLEPEIINSQCACAARVTVVVVCVCLSLHSTSQAINRSTNNTTYSASDKGRKLCRLFSETAAFESYGVKHERKRQNANYNRLTSSGSACSAYLERIRSHNERSVSTAACYLLL